MRRVTTHLLRTLPSAKDSADRLRQIRLAKGLFKQIELDHFGARTSEQKAAAVIEHSLLRCSQIRRRLLELNFLPADSRYRGSPFFPRRHDGEVVRTLEELARLTKKDLRRAALEAIRWRKYALLRHGVRT